MNAVFCTHARAWCSVLWLFQSMLGERWWPIELQKTTAVERKQSRIKLWGDSVKRSKGTSIFTRRLPASAISYFWFATWCSYRDKSERLIVAITRYCFSILLILMVRALQRVKTFGGFASIVTIMEAASIFLYISMYCGSINLPTSRFSPWVWSSPFCHQHRSWTGS